MQGSRDRAENVRGESLPGGVEDLGATYDAYAPLVLAYVRSLGVAPSLGEDILQEVFLRLLRRGRRGAAVGNMRAFLLTIARREFYRWGTRILRRREISAGGISGAFETAAAGGSVEKAAAIEDALSKLPVPQREVVVMKVFGGLTFEEIAGAMETSPNTAASRYRYAMDKLEKLLGEG